MGTMMAVETTFPARGVLVAKCIKRPRVRRYEEVSDARTQLFADIHWSDEGNHVQYGKRWVNHFLKDDAQSIE